MYKCDNTNDVVSLTTTMARANDIVVGASHYPSKKVGVMAIAVRRSMRKWQRQTSSGRDRSKNSWSGSACALVPVLAPVMRKREQKRETTAGTKAITEVCVWESNMTIIYSWLKGSFFGGNMKVKVNEMKIYGALVVMSFGSLWWDADVWCPAMKFLSINKSINNSVAV